MSYQLLQGDCLKILPTLPAGSVQCCVTSPPYYGLRDYGNDAQIGLEETPAAYVEKLVAVFRDVWRVLADDGVVFLNLGDSYFGSGKGRNADGSHQGGGKQGTNRGTVEGKLFKTGRANDRHVASYGTSDKAPEGYQVSDCLCGNLCDVCRVVYQSRKSHTYDLLGPMLIASLSLPNLGHKGFEIGHAPTWDSRHLAYRILPAIRDLLHSPDHAGELLPSVLGSMPDEFSRQLLDVCLQRDSRGECLLCARTLADCALESVRMSPCPCAQGLGSSSIQDSLRNTNGKASIACSSDYHIGDKVFDLPYPHYTTTSHQWQLKPKDLIGIPWRVAFALQEDGWYLRSDIIWAKPNAMPESVTDRCTRSHEYVFMLTKSGRYYYDADAIKEPAGEHIGRAATFARSGAVSEHILPGQSAAQHRPDRVSKQRGHGRRHDGFNDRWDAMTKAEQQAGMRNKRDVWTVAPSAYSGAHFATMPPDLAAPCILAGSRPGDTVLDPFSGSGTTGESALRYGRQYVGIELNPDYIQLAHKRIAPYAAQMQLFQEPAHAAV